MKSFADRIQLTSQQRKEVQGYLKSSTVFSEEAILRIIRKIKELERKVEEKRYG